MTDSRKLRIAPEEDAAASRITSWSRLSYQTSALARATLGSLQRTGRWIAEGWTGTAPSLAGSPRVRLGLLAAGALLLIGATWLTLAGGRRQLSTTMTPGQRFETAVQFASGVLSLLSLVTCFRWRRWRSRLLGGWAISLATAAGLSSLVWGPPMLSVGLVFSAGAALLALVTSRLLRAGLAE